MAFSLGWCVWTRARAHAWQQLCVQENVIHCFDYVRECTAPSGTHFGNESSKTQTRIFSLVVFLCLTPPLVFLDSFVISLPLRCCHDNSIKIQNRAVLSPHAQHLCFSHRNDFHWQISPQPFCCGCRYCSCLEDLGHEICYWFGNTSEREFNSAAYKFRVKQTQSRALSDGLANPADCSRLILRLHN